MDLPENAVLQEFDREFWPVLACQLPGKGRSMGRKAVLPSRDHGLQANLRAMHNAARQMDPLADIAAIDAIRALLEASENGFDPEPMIEAMAEDMVLMVPSFPVTEGKAASAKFVREINCWMKEAFERRVISYTSNEVSVTGGLAFDRGVFRRPVWIA